MKYRINSTVSHLGRRFLSTKLRREIDIKIVEVGPRDGLQNEMRMVPAEIKFSLVKKLIEAGCKNIESASFVNPNKIPAMANSKEVCTLLNSWRNEGNLKYDDVVLSALTPNLRGFEDARGIVDEVAIFASASEMFSQKNIGCSIEESFVRFEEVMIAAKEAHIPVRGYVSCILGCPYSNRVAPTSVADVSLRLLEMGCYEISLGDTIGVGTANKTKNLLKVLKQVGVDPGRLAVHFHDTFGQALSNIYVSLEEDIRVIDSSVAGLGGCPYATGASGNVATEDVLYMLNGLGLSTGIDLDKIVDIGHFITDHLGITSKSKCGTALFAKKQKNQN